MANTKPRTTLSSLFQPLFSEGSRERGESYFRQGRVSVTRATPTAATAAVRGTGWYTVSIDVTADGVRVTCDCSFIQEYGAPCKHIWGTILGAERKGKLTGGDIEFLPRLILPDGTILETGATRDNGSVADSADSPAGSARARRRDPAFAEWQKLLTAMTVKRQAPVRETTGGARIPSEIFYRIDLALSSGSGAVMLDLMERTTGGRDAGSLMPVIVGVDQIPMLQQESDRRILSIVAGAHNPQQTYFGVGSPAYGRPTLSRIRIDGVLQKVLLPEICGTGRCVLVTRQITGDMQRLAWDGDKPWELWLALRRADDGYAATLELRRNGVAAPSPPLMAFQGGVVIFDRNIALFDDGGAFDWMLLFGKRESITIPDDQIEPFLDQLLATPFRPRIELPEELAYTEAAGVPKPVISLKSSSKDSRKWEAVRIEAELLFDYNGRRVASDDTIDGLYRYQERLLLKRDREAEERAAELLQELGFKPVRGRVKGGVRYELGEKKLGATVRQLVAEGWQVEAEGKIYRQPGASSLEVRSGIDWFELHGSIDFGGVSVGLPKLLAALRKKETTVLLDDGTLGLMPEEWLAKFARVAMLGKAGEEYVRFSRGQVGVLDALLAAQPEILSDDLFENARRELMDFRGVESVEPPPTFNGELRDYQKEGLGWLLFLRRFGFGGCLADSMGLGKTVQVLALLEARRLERANVDATDSDPLADRPKGPSLAVVPKSLIFNWRLEAEHFAPGLRVLEHVGLQRAKDISEFEGYDLVVTTYGTLRRDVAWMMEADFDYIILDEAQAIKNSASASAKAARLLKGGHRLALTGTPVENHLGELWSLLEFLNPGMLGAESVLNLSVGGGRIVDDSTRDLLSRALRPFILRRTKEQVAKDLPERTEQEISCEMEPAQRQLYDELRDHYRSNLLQMVDEEGMGSSKIKILEALLRLRQVACHPGLVDKKRVDEPSAKLETLEEMLQEIVESGSKALVFSQFTSLLSIVRTRLDRRGITYEYLDGKTKDRQERVERFQSDPECPLFLISLKAGGVGLNLTAAEYVFLLDPWWNPAVEAQAIDRTHRIGQTKPVIAYRLIARDTIEEKVLALQHVKRELAEAVIGEENALIRSLGREDLEFLLG
jgi:superfamily II DNA or RNA helicase